MHSIARFFIFLVAASAIAASARSSQAVGTTFTDIGASLSQTATALAWGDYDNDGDLDLAVCGGGSKVATTQIYRNDGGAFSDSGIGLLGVAYGAIAWGDYDNDGDLDLVVAGSVSNSPVTKLYRNDGDGVFTDTEAPIAGADSGSLAWGDYDNDGDLDLLLTGHTLVGPVCRIYRNDRNGVFTDIQAGLTGVYCGSCALWADYDSDGDLDVVVAGASSMPDTDCIAKIYANNGGTFTDIQASLPGLDSCSIDWGDYDNDGDLDLIISGRDVNYPMQSFTKLYRNDLAGFAAVSTGLPNVAGSGVAWGDYNNDGKPDLALSGSIVGQPGSRVSGVFQGSGTGVFADSGAVIQPSYGGSLEWGDYDNDGDLDLAIVGTLGGGKIYRNDGSLQNARPSPPTNLTAQVSGPSLVLSWSPGSDPSTPTPGLSYNVRVGTYPGGCDVVSPMSDPVTGLRRIPGPGNAQKCKRKVLTYMPGGKLYWSVQSIDSGFAASAWAPEQVVDSPFVKVSGRILRPNGEPEKNVLITPEYGGPQAATDATGYYCFYVPPLWSATVIPVKNQCSFEPASRAYVGVTSDQPGGDYVSHPYVKISGHVLTSSGAAANGLNVQIGAQSCTVKSDGYYELTVPYGLTADIAPQCATVPAKRSIVSISADLPDQDFTPVRYLVDVQGYIDSIDHAGSASAWADYDCDGDLDVAIAGSGDGYSAVSAVTRVFRNDNGVLVDSGVQIVGVLNGAIAWGDYDNDGRPDLAIAGMSPNGRVSRIYHNNGDGSFTDIGAKLAAVDYCALAWGDYNNDGKLDLTLSGRVGGNTVARTSVIYQNKGGGQFVDILAPLPALEWSTLAWGDYDGDGDLDLLLAGYAGVASSKLFRNQGDGTFADSGIHLPGCQWGTAIWGDFDNDGDLDLVETGPFGKSAYIRNDGGGKLTNTGPLVSTQSGSRAIAGDYDCDGDLDLVITDSMNSTWLLINDGTGKFTYSTMTYLPDFSYLLALGDYDNDGDLDALAYSGAGLHMFRNDGLAANTLPSVPRDLSVAISGDVTTFSWKPGTDAQTPVKGLTYNLRVGTMPGADDVFSGMADPVTGQRRVAAMGNVQDRLSWTLKGLPAGPLYWSVQAIDASFVGSAWAPEALNSLTSGAAKKLASGTRTQVSGVVTASWPDFFYIESENRSSGIRVDKAGHGVGVGAKVFVVGDMGVTADGEPFVSALTIVPVGEGSVVPPLMVGRSPRGGRCGLQEETWCWRWIKQPDKTVKLVFLPDCGLSDVGLLVKVYGKITQKDPEGSYFYIDDGTLLRDGSQTESAANVGLRVISGTQYQTGDMVCVTGIASCFRADDGKLRKMLRAVDVSRLD